MVKARHTFLICFWFVVVIVFMAYCKGQEVAPLRKVNASPETLADVLSRLPEADAKAAYVDSCRITYTHEAVHFLNSRLSNARERAFYLGDGDYLVLPIPKRAKLLHAAEAVPEKYRGKTYKTYLVDAQEWWQDIPLYTADEAVAYWAGAMARREMGQASRQETERFGVELLVYTRYAFQEIERREPTTYPKAALRDLLDLLVARARIICPEFDQQPYARALTEFGRDQ
jgi:hypothetical protein